MFMNIENVNKFIFFSFSCMKQSTLAHSSVVNNVAVMLV